MGLGKRKRESQGTFWVPTDKLGSGPRNVFYDRLNGLLAEIDFDGRLEAAAAPYYATTGRKGLAPGVYFRMLFIGYFEGIDSQRGIAWRCDDSRSLARFLGKGPGEETPDHSTLTLTRNRLPLEVHQLAFELVLGLCHEKGLLKGKTLGVDASDLEANAAMKSIVRRENGDDWQEYVRKLYEAETGVSDPDDEELRRFDRKRKKKVSNDEWVNPHDPDARIGKMKDGRTHLKYKVEHAVDLETEVIVAAEVYEGTAGDCSTIEDTVNAARTNLREAKTGCDVEEVAADKGYHSEESLDRLQHETHVRTYIPQPKRPKSRKPKRKPPRRQAAYRRNRRNARGRRGRRLQRLRSEKVERTFAHVLETGGGRRTWLRGLAKIRKRYLVAAVAYNLGRILRQLLGAGKPKQFGDLQAALFAALGLSGFAYFAVRARRTIVRISIAIRLALLMTRRSATFETLRLSRTEKSTAC
jgi:transposase